MLTRALCPASAASAVRPAPGRPRCWCPTVPRHVPPWPGGATRRGRAAPGPPALRRNHRGKRPVDICLRVRRHCSARWKTFRPCATTKSVCLPLARNLLHGPTPNKPSAVPYATVWHRRHSSYPVPRRLSPLPRCLLNPAFGLRSRRPRPPPLPHGPLPLAPAAAPAGPLASGASSLLSGRGSSCGGVGCGLLAK